MPRSTAGKYDAILPGLPPLPPADLKYQERVELAKAEVTDRDATALAEEYIRLRAEKDKINEKLSRVSLQIEAHEQLLADSKESKAPGWGLFGVKDNALRLASGDTIRIQKEPYGKVADKEAFRLWCVAPADRCMECGEREAAPWHDELTSTDENTHAFRPGGGMERQLQLWPSTMNAIVKERLVVGMEPPDGVAAFSYTKVMFVKAGSGTE